MGQPQRIHTLHLNSWVTGLVLEEGVVVTASNDGVVTMWDLNDGTAKVSFKHLQPVTTVASLGHVLACGSTDSSISVWKLPNGDLMHKFQHAKPVGAVALHGSKLASGSDDCTAVIWCLSTGEQLGTFQHDDAVGCIALQEELLVTGSDDCTVGLWNPTKKTRLLTLPHKSWITSLVVSKGAIITATFDKTVVVWDIFTGDQLNVLLFEDTVLSAAIDGNLLALGLHNGSTSLVQLPDARRLPDLTFQVSSDTDDDPYPIHAVAIRDGILVSAPGDCTAVVLRLPTSC